MQVSTSFFTPEIQRKLKGYFRAELKLRVFDLNDLISSFSKHTKHCDCTVGQFYLKYRSWTVAKGEAPVNALAQLIIEGEPVQKETMRPVSKEETDKIREQLVALTTTQG